MPDLPGVLQGSREIQEAHTDCRQLTGNYVKEGILENPAQQVQPKEEEATLATDIEMGSVAEVWTGGTSWLPNEIHSP